MSHYNEFSAIAEIDPELARSFWAQIITDPEQAQLDATASSINLRHLSAHLQGSDDYQDVEKTLRTWSIPVEPFDINFRAISDARITGFYVPTSRQYPNHATSLSADVTVDVAGFNAGDSDQLARLRGLGSDFTPIESGSMINFWTSFEKGRAPIIKVAVPLLTVQSEFVTSKEAISRGLASSRHHLYLFGNCVDCLGVGREI